MMGPIAIICGPNPFVHQETNSEEKNCLENYLGNYLEM